jgi:hypothetical protein
MDVKKTKSPSSKKAALARRRADPEIEERIGQRIEAYRKAKAPTRKEQRAELVWRNQEFQSDFNKVLESLTGPIDYNLDLEKQVSLSFWELIPFFTKWRIDPQWNGHPKELPERVSVGLEFFASCGQVPHRHFGTTLIITIDKWTTWGEVRRAWKRAETWRRDLYGGRVKNQKSFARYLCWYDLTQDRYGNLGPGDIVIKWRGYLGKNVPVNTIKAGIGRMKTMIASMSQRDLGPVRYVTVPANKPHITE